MRNIANNFLRLRTVNTELVRKALKDFESVTKSGLAAITGLSIATCGNILADMLARNEVLELDLGQPEGGRPPRLYAYNPMFSLTALLFPKAEAGGKRIIHAVVDAKGGTVEQDSFAVDRADLAALDALLARLRQAYPNIKAAAASIPGLVWNGTVGFCDLPELTGASVESHLRNKHDMPVTVDNDMNLAALGYAGGHPEAGAGPVVYLVAPSRNCAGAGIVVDGKPLRGFSSFAGELSFLPGGPDRTAQFAGLTPEEALAYAARLAGTVIPIVNPSVLVVASDLLAEDAADAIRKACLARIPPEHMPELAFRQAIDDDCLAGLATMAAASLSSRVRLVEDDHGGNA